ncbi:cyclic di-GMP receptor LapD [Pseudomonas sp. DWP3-1-2]|uniref:cyclic di-GMP receptor LapD n=1 Tax=Pseudomonas sp. DWP3-1-2 TaxID=2804645 RepID=UPI003CF57F07
MSLFKQLLIAICLFLVVAFSGSFLISLESSRSQYTAQLHAHAQDAATALALSLTPVIDDPAMTQLMVSAIFDSGYYASINVVDLASGQSLVQRSARPNANDVPAWFARLIALKPADGSAVINRGWQQAARVEVVSHPMFAVGKLWQSALGSLVWLLACGLVSAVLGGLLLRRQLRPLDYLVAQSDAIARREFLSQSALPGTPELRRVVQAMNQMVDKLQALFVEHSQRTEQLRAEAWQDSLTGLGNRRYFDMQLAEHLAYREEACSGYLLLLRVNDLAGMNERLGGHRTDALLLAIGELLTRHCVVHPETRHLIARNRGGEFAVLAPGMARDSVLSLVENLQVSLASLQETGASDVTPVALIGVVPFQPGDSPSTLFGRADQALVEAQTNDDAGLSIAPRSDASGPEDDHHAWYLMLDQALTRHHFQLFLQPVVDTRDTAQVLHHKVLARLRDPQGQLLPAGRFLPWIERFGWSSRLDLLMLESTFELLAQRSIPLALSVSVTTLENPVSRAQAFDLLRRQAHLASRLTLEIDGRRLAGEAGLQVLTTGLHELGYALAVQHFGGRFSMIGNLSSLGLAYLKIDGSYIRNMDIEVHKRLFIEALQRAAHSIDLPLIAERVETDGELRVIREMGIQGAQGQLFGAPAPWQ